MKTYKTNQMNNMSRVPFGVLLAFVISTIISVPVYAETVGDFELYLGYTPEQVEESMKEYKENEPEKEVDTSYSYESVDDTSKIEHMRDKVTKSKSELEAFYLKQASPNKVNSLLKVYQQDSEAYNNQMRLERSNIPTELANGYTAEDLIHFVDYDIGIVGEYIKPITKSLALVTPYGYPIIEEHDVNDDGEQGEKTGIKAIGDLHSGIDIAAREDDTIMSQWNGKVIDIKSEEGSSNGSDGLGNLQEIEVYHGNGLYTKYKHLKSVIVPLGSMVGQFEQIGTVGNSSKCSCNKTFQGETIEQLTNHIHFEVRVEKENINPLLVYQENGKGAFTKWYTSSLCKYALPEGTEMYKNPKKEIAIDNSDIGTQYFTAEELEAAKNYTPGGSGGSGEPEDLEDRGILDSLEDSGEDYSGEFGVSLGDFGDKQGYLGEDTGYEE